MTGFRLQTSGFRKSGFTLIELLLVISIIGILAGLSITVTRQVYHTGRVAKTEATILKIDQVLMEMYAGFENRRVPSPNFGGASDLQARVTQAARLWLLRDMMRMEMPCNWAEVMTGPVDFSFRYGNGNLEATGYISMFPDAESNMRKKDSPLRQLYHNAYQDALDRSDLDTVNRYGSAKCLYLVVMYGNPEARELFVDSEIATDDDGLSYFVDGWGNPIYFLRWAPGFVLSERQQTVLLPNQTTDDWDAIDANKIAAAEARPDPLDPTEIGGITDGKPGHNSAFRPWHLWQFNIDAKPDAQRPAGAPPMHGWTLLPVVMSSGGVRDDDNFDDSFGIMLMPPDNVPAVDPFKWAIGAPVAAGRNHAIIHNHSARR